MSRRPRYLVHVTYETGVLHRSEHTCSSLKEADRLARIAIEDYCLLAEVAWVENGNNRNTVVSRWTPERLKKQRESDGASTPHPAGSPAG